jgi:uncharacterized membrane protein SirB2
MNQLMIQHTHLLVAVLFLSSYLYKTILFLGPDKQKFEKYRKATLIPENILATLFLLTGLYLVYTKGAFSNSFYTPWFHIKFALAILAIPVGIIGFKKSNRMLIILSATMFLVVLFLALVNGSSNFL